MEWMKTSDYVTNLAFANIEGVNICWSRQLSFLASAKKVLSFESGIQATSYNIVLIRNCRKIFPKWTLCELK